MSGRTVKLRSGGEVHIDATGFDIFWLSARDRELIATLSDLCAAYDDEARVAAEVAAADDARFATQETKP